MANLKTIAQQAGVSVETVSRVLNGRYRGGQQRGKDRVAQITQIARQLGYRANAAARSMQTHRTMQIGVVLTVDPRSQLTHAAASETVFGINSRLMQDGYIMTLAPIAHQPDADGSESRALREKTLDGVILLDDLQPALNEAMADLPLPKVWVNTGPLLAQDCVGRNEIEAGELCLEALADLGYGHVVYLDRAEATHFSFCERWQGVRRAARQRKVQLQRFSVELGRRIQLSQTLRSTIAHRAALAVSDVYLARRVQTELALDGICAGRDYALACCDDSDELKETFPELARVSFDRFNMGRLAADMMLEKLRQAKPDAASACALPSLKVPSQWMAGRSAPPAATLPPAAEPQNAPPRN
jgi:DNA-binding LacI/PurR family transcriptional regulator